MRYNSIIYKNGNYVVMDTSFNNKLFSMKKRALRIGEEFKSEFPDSIVFKISNRCSNGCPFCHESSVKNGKLFNIDRTKEILSQINQPIEIALGGGNLLESFDITKEFILWLNSKHFRPRITLRIEDFLNLKNDDADFLRQNIDAIGVSVSSISSLKKFMEKDYSTGFYMKLDSFYVYHIIVGILPINDLMYILDEMMNSSVLILGFKQWGRAKNMSIPDLEEWKKTIKVILLNPTYLRSNYLGFDNLACEQLGIKDYIDIDTWNHLYLGEEGSCSMYIDAVEEQYARTSRSPERVSWNEMSLLDFYASLNK